MILDKLGWFGKPPPGDCRKIILHYHLFKNAGSSIDHILRENFGEGRWHSEEFPRPTNTAAILTGRSNAQLVQDWLAGHPEVLVLSSHTAVMPLPKLPATRVFPIIMVRNPVIRLQSSYLFQRKRFESGFHNRTTTLAGQNDLAGYLRGLLEMKRQSMARNFSSVRLAAAVPGSPDRLRQRAFKALKLLPFVGVVELFDQSMHALERWLAPHFPGFQVLPAWQNASDRSSESLSDRLAGIREAIGGDLYRELLAANRIDLDIHRAASREIVRAAGTQMS
ncbi:MAG: hypothetical protein OXP09_21360 [Gammaproteobacteria bacterium]|nr:hypothetical protein [Rhodospirillaceae bacterium]MDE0368105.1 hypothetical protein [Gammaproteobacteria bacterium]